VVTTVLSNVVARLTATVRLLCPIVARRLDGQRKGTLAEPELRHEAVACLLGSQVPQRSAAFWTRQLQAAGLLDDDWWTVNDAVSFQGRVLQVLSGNGTAETPKYRFYALRSVQLAKMRDALARAPLTERFGVGLNPREVRSCLVRDLAGIGPKQASMLLRNIGYSYDLAILDVHVRRYCAVVGLDAYAQGAINTLAGYERAEEVLVRYAEAIGYPTGYVDWAIWLTMRAAREVDLWHS
jgi:N-glycosylase/DNA lyase